MARRPNPFRTLLVVAALLVAGAAAAAADAFLVEPSAFEVRRVDVRLPRLPDAWVGRKVVLLSDLHLGAGTRLEDLERVVDLVNGVSPDLVLFLGDAVDSRTPQDGELTGRAAAALAEIRAPLGKFACIGNHDDRLPSERAMFLDLMEGGGFVVLVNDSVAVDGIRVGGIDEAYFGAPDPAAVFDGAAPGDFRILLAHHPWLGLSDGVLEAAAPDLVASGHTHGGQATLFGAPIPFYTALMGEYAAGLYRKGPAVLYVTRGLGTFGVRARFFCRPEITVLELRKA